MPRPLPAPYPMYRCVSCHRSDVPLDDAPIRSKRGATLCLTCLRHPAAPGPSQPPSRKPPG